MNNLIKLIEEQTKKDSKSLVETALKLSEECGEVSQAVLSLEKIGGCDYKGLGKDDVLEETIDCVLVALSLHFKCGGDTESVKKLMVEKLNKWKKVSR